MCVHYGFNIISRMLLERIWGDWTSLDRYSVILSCFIDQNIQNYVKIDHDDQNQNITFMIKILFLCVHYGFNIISRMLLDHIWGDWASLDRYSVILSCFIDQNIQNYVKIDHDDQNQNITFITIVCTLRIQYHI